MSKLEKLELDAYGSKIVADVKKLVEKYRAIFDWDIPEIDQIAADTLILKAIRKSLECVEEEILKGVKE